LRLIAKNLKLSGRGNKEELILRIKSISWIVSAIQ
jgi:hypothetical protein